jgi:hypothetical protein
MIFKGGLLLLLLFLLLHSSISFAQPAPDVRARIAIDGTTGEYSPDEWILDHATSFPEPAGDSRWGMDNDIRRIAVTWDYYNLYIAVDCSILNGSVLLGVDCACGGPEGLQSDPLFMRNISFRDFTPNILVRAVRSLQRPEAEFADCAAPSRVLLNDQYSAAIFQGEYPQGAVEIALPWEQLIGFRNAGSEVVLPAAGYSLSVLAAVTGGDATGAGDAAPNPTHILSDDSTQSAVLDNFIIIPLDLDEDGILDVGTAPRDIVTFARSEELREGTTSEIALAVEAKSFAPDLNERLRFRPVFVSGSSSPVLLTARVYSVSGRLVRVLYRDRPVAPAAGSSAEWEMWDGRDSDGDVVPGGIYIISVSAAAGAAGIANAAKAAVAVIR